MIFLYLKVDKCAYTKLVNGELVIICLYVDVMLIFSTNDELVLVTKRYLPFKFDMKYMGEANGILGVKIIRRKWYIMLESSKEVWTLCFQTNEYSLLC